MTPDEFKIACLYLEDCQRLIAAGKVQRWEVVKWAVITTNLALATASILPIIRLAHFGWLILIFSVLVAAAGGYLVFHFNRRMTGARDNATRVKTYLSDNKIDLSSLEKPPSKDRASRTPSMYDAEELYIFGYVIAGSMIPSFLAWILS